VLVNRAHLPVAEATLTTADRARLDALGSAGAGSLAERVAGAANDATQLAAADARSLTILDSLAQPRKLVPHFNRDLHSMADLVAFSDALTASDALTQLP
jgi:hypothetical protein